MKKTFTIIELLISIAVLVILMSLLQPSLQNTLKTAKGAVCMNNLRSLGSAMAIYTQDYHRFTPYYNHKASSLSGQNGVTWDDMLGQGYDSRNLSNEDMDKNYLEIGYQDQTQMYLCPLDDADYRTADTSRADINQANLRYQQRTYSINSYGSVGPNTWPEDRRQGIAGLIYGSGAKPWAATVSSLINPGELIMITERPGLGFVGGGWNRHTRNISWQDNTVFEPIFNVTFSNIRYHQSGYNYLFADGHIENMTPEETMGPNGTRGNPGGFWSNRTDD